MAQRPPMFMVKKTEVNQHTWYKKDAQGNRTSEIGGVIRSQAVIYEYEVDGELLRTPTRIGLGDDLPPYQPGSYFMDGASMVPGVFGLELARTGMKLVPAGK